MLARSLRFTWWGWALLACGASTPERAPTPTAAATAPAKPAPAPRSTMPEAEEVPSDWFWVTDRKGALEIAMPSLPLASSSPGSGSLVSRVLVATKGERSFEIASTPVTSPSALADATQALRTLGPTRDEAPWREHGLALTRDTPTGPVHMRVIEIDGRVYALGVSGPASSRDVETLFSSFSARAEPRRGTVHDDEKGYRLEAPARMGRWRDLAGIPPLVGHRGLLDGLQFSVSDTDLLIVPDPNAGLDGAVASMLAEVEGTIVELDSKPWQARPSRRVELRANDGMYATIRLVMNGSRLVQVAVYAPSGREAPWADAYVDSLAIDEQ